MYLAVDIGGSKTLFAVFSPDGQIVAKHKIATNLDYKKFLKDVANVLSNELKDHKITHCCCALPGSIDRKRGIGLTFGNLKWQNVPIQEDFKKVLQHVPVLVEHDSNLGGLAEALLVQDKYKKVLYLTLSTGIGNGIIINGKVDPDFAESEAGHMVIEHNGKLEKWEDFASGRALLEQYGKQASEIDDPVIWKSYAYNVSLGLDALIAILQPEVVIIGGGVGTHLDKFSDLLNNELKKLENNMVTIPPIIKAKRPEEAVIYGCYDYIRQNFS